jgi:hypothetical protein
MFIYRMENERGVGPYRKEGGLSDEFFEEVLEHHNRLTGRPAPCEEFKRDIKESEICGFNSLRQIVKWFKSWERKELKRVGFKIVKREVKKITAIGKKQVLAIK